MYFQYSLFGLVELQLEYKVQMSIVVGNTNFPGRDYTADLAHKERGTDTDECSEDVAEKKNNPP